MRTVNAPQYFFSPNSTPVSLFVSLSLILSCGGEGSDLVRLRWIQTRCQRHSCSTTTPRSMQIGRAWGAYTRRSRCSPSRARKSKGRRTSSQSLLAFPSSSASTTSQPSIASPRALLVACSSSSAATSSSAANSMPLSSARCSI